MATELAKAIFLQIGFQRWEAIIARGRWGHIVRSRIDHRAAFLGGTLFGQTCSGSQARIT